MTSANKYVTSNGLDYDFKQNKWNSKKKIEFPLPDDTIPNGYGRSITINAFRKMIGDHILKLYDVFSEMGVEKTNDKFEKFLETQKCSVEFGKETILRVLAQDDCIGLRFTFCVNDTGEDSVIVSGIGVEKLEDGKSTTCLLNKAAYKVSQTTTTLGDNQNVSMSDDQEPPPMNEEKGVPQSYSDFFKQTGTTLRDLVPQFGNPPALGGNNFLNLEFDNNKIDKITDAVLGL